MPKVGGRKYAYNKAGMAAAKRRAKKTGLPLVKNSTRGMKRPKKAPVVRRRGSY